MIRFLVEQNNFVASSQQSNIITAEEEHCDPPTTNPASRSSEPSEYNQMQEERFFQTLNFAKKFLPASCSTPSLPKQPHAVTRRYNKVDFSTTMPFAEDEKDLFLAGTNIMIKSRRHQQTEQHNELNHDCIPIINLPSTISGSSSVSYTSKSEVRRDSSFTEDVAFEEGTSAFASPINLSLIEVDGNIIDAHDYSSKAITSSLLFNLGICKARKSDYYSAKTHFRQAIALLLDIDQSFVLVDDSKTRAAATMKENIFVTINLLTSMALLNLGHIEWHLNNADGSINFYHQCLDCLRSFHIAKSKVNSFSNEANFCCDYIMATCLNCIGMVFLNTKLVPLVAEDNDKLVQAQGKACLKYFEASLSIFEDHEEADEVAHGHASTSFTANMATVFNNLGRVYFIIGDYEQALCCYQECLDRRLFSLPLTHLDLGVCYFNVAQTMQTLRYTSEALEHYLTYLSIATPTLGYAHTYIVKTVLIVADLYISEKDYDNAQSILQEHLSSSAFISIEQLKSKITLLNTLSKVFNSQDKIEDALETLLQVRNIILPLPEDDFLIQSYVTNSGNMAALLVETGKLEEALLLYQRAMKKLKKYEQQDNEDLAFPDLLAELHVNIAHIYEVMSNFSDCILHLEQAVSLKKNTLGATDFKVSATMNYLGLVYYKANKYDSALSTFLECLDIRTNSNIARKSDIVAVLYNVATVYKAIGETNQALEIYLKVLKYERSLIQKSDDDDFGDKTTSSQPKDLILTLRHIFEIYDQELGVPMDGMKYLFEAMSLCRQYKQSIEARLGRDIFFLLGDVLSSNQKSAEGFEYYCEGCKLFGNVDTDAIIACGEKGLRMILAQMCNDSRVFPLHAAAA
ncbi:hypothetical protein CTEN210_00613 [Chaetoceros tenuissimus]|uniref:Uncharacterized protein n=1 Tax=Chaetoceros tenuissimus TaxID=426638 RepID=A0AAD3CEG3_9STRA|nr:hypothetical protein CTEN210_00613 [Chaetoceros tenuissimus]